MTPHFQLLSNQGVGGRWEEEELGSGWKRQLQVRGVSRVATTSIIISKLYGAPTLSQALINTSSVTSYSNLTMTICLYLFKCLRKLTEMLAQGHSDGEYQYQDLNPGILAPQLYPVTLSNSWMLPKANLGSNPASLTKLLLLYLTLTSTSSAKIHLHR